MAASRTPLVRLGHVIDEIDALAAALKGVDFETFVGSYIYRRTAEHAVLIISEAVKALPPEATAPHPAIDWRSIRTIGNVLRHEYFEVDARVLWRIVTDRLPELRPVITRMMEDHSR